VRTTSRRLLWPATIILLAGCAISDHFVTRIPPRSSTCGTILITKERILRYVRLHDCLPQSPSDLPEIPQRDNSLQDGWGREILTSFVDGKATLTSLGRDGRPGGSGEDADMSGVFSLKDENGAWAAEDVGWIEEPRL
jgi:hypothetical protein